MNKAPPMNEPSDLSPTCAICRGIASSLRATEDWKHEPSAVANYASMISWSNLIVNFALGSLGAMISSLCEIHGPMLLEGLNGYNLTDEQKEQVLTIAARGLQRLDA